MQYSFSSTYQGHGICPSLIRVSFSKLIGLTSINHLRGVHKVFTSVATYPKMLSGVKWTELISSVSTVTLLGGHESLERHTEDCLVCPLHQVTT